jgi:hypothetical protein
VLEAYCLQHSSTRCIHCGALSAWYEGQQATVLMARLSADWQQNTQCQCRSPTFIAVYCWPRVGMQPPFDAL